MRSCPSCQREYPDAVFFCGEDGTITVQVQTPEDFDPRLGKRLGGYIVVARVADGAMGRVYEGRHPETRARVAIKVLHREVLQDAVAVERFKREFETSTEMRHPHVVHVLEFGDTDDGSYFMTMEYLVGEELGRALTGGQALPVARALRALAQVALGLRYAHSFGFIHRDLKPDNIFLCDSEAGDDVRILDFGSVKLQMDLGQKLTAIGTTIGSPFYMSPEQAMGKADVDQRTDVFALGAIVYEALTGCIAFDAPSLAKILMRIMNETPIPPTQIDSALPAGIDSVVLRALAKEKEERFAAPVELIDALFAAFGLDAGCEAWASRDQKELQTALEAATPPAALPASVAAPASEGRPRRDEDNTERVRHQGRGGGGGNSLSVPRSELSRRLPMLLGSAVAIVVLGSALAMLLR